MIKFKLFFTFILVVVVLIGSCIASFAATYTPYGGLTDTSSQVNILYDYYRNLVDFDYNDEFIIMRTDQYAYYLFYSDSLSDSSVYYISYTSEGQYNSQYVIDMGVDSNFRYTINNYTIVGNIPGTAAVSEHYSSYHQFLIQVFSFVFLILFIFYIFRSHFKELA